MNTRTALTIGIVGGALALVGGGGGVIAASQLADDASASAPTVSSPTASPRVETDPADREDAAVEAGGATEGYDTTAALLFLIEEEKLAHDVYVTLSDLWGANVFANIASSEATHQNLVEPLLEDRDIADPRSTEIGVFTDPELQALYDELVALGSQSLDAAIQAGITIEEKDIADLSESIAAEDEVDVVSVLERLLAGSENHLRSFERLA
jgi:hypothetical protein